MCKQADCMANLPPMGTERDRAKQKKKGLLE